MSSNNFLIPVVRFPFDLKIIYSGTILIEKLAKIIDFNKVELDETYCDIKLSSYNISLGVISENMTWYPCTPDLNHDILGDDDMSCITKSDFGFLKIDLNGIKIQILDGENIIKYIKSSIYFKKNTIGADDSISISFSKI